MGSAKTNWLRSDWLKKTPWLSKNLIFPKKLFYTSILSLKMKMREFVDENFTGRQVILLNCPGQGIVK